MNPSRKLKILVITDSLPFPLSSGGKVCTFNFIDYLRKQHDFTLFYPVYQNGISEDKTKLQNKWPDVNLKSVFIPNDSATQIKSGFLKTAAKKVRRKLEDLARKNEKASSGIEWKRLDFTQPFKPQSLSYIQELKNLCDGSRFDIIQVQYTHYLNLIEVLPKESKIIFEQIESQFDVLRDYAITHQLDESYQKYLIGNCESLENFYISKYQAVFTLNEKDKKYFESKFQTSKVYASPFGVLESDITTHPVFNFVPEKIIFSGNEYHHPNYDALEWYLSKVHPLVTPRHNLNVYVTGNWSEKAIKYFTSLSVHVKFLGFVDDYMGLLKKSIVIVPIRIGGGGLRTKTLYAMSNAAPVVTTSIGAFGIEAYNKEFLVADTEKEFADSINQLMTHQDLVSQMTEKAFLLVKEKYSQSVTSERRNKFYLDIIG